MNATTNDDSAEDAVLADRRRPGRPSTISPELIGLLRSSELNRSIAENDFREEEGDQLSGARGLVWAVGLSIPAWVGIVSVGRWLLS